MVATKTEVYRKMRVLLAEALGADEDEIAWETNVYDDLNADVMEFHDEVIHLVEETFGVTIEDEDVPELTTVRELVDYVVENI